MKHTNFIPMDACPQERRNPNVLKSPSKEVDDSRFQRLLRCLGLVLILFCFSNSLAAQTKVLTGSGSSTCNDVFNFGVDQTGGAFYEDDATLGRQEFIVCPSPATQGTHLSKLAITSFDVAPGDTISIYEGCGTAGNLLNGFPYYGGGASAATSLPSSWFLADCEGDGCLTVVFAPNGDKNKGAGIDFETSCEPRMTTITCPSDVVVAASCIVDASGVGTISGNHTIQGLSGTCKVTPTIVATELFAVPVSGIVVTTGATPTTVTPSTVTTIGNIENLVPGEYSIRIIYQDVPGGTTADPNDTCAYNIVVDSGITPVCNDHVNVSLSGACEAVITVDNILEGNHDCTDNFIVQLLDGENKDTNIVNASYLGTTARVQVIEPTSGNRCWGYVTVEDKLAPVLNCVDMAIYCTTTTDPAVIGGQPTTIDVCSGSVTYNFTDAETSFSCKPGRVLTEDGDGNPLTVEPDTIGLVIRTWTAVDGNGNVSFPCTQEIYVLKPQLVADDIIWPADTLMYCGEYSLHCGDNSDCSASITGYPSVKVGDDTIRLDQSCFFGLNHQDQVFATDCEGSKKILRTWTILDWCHPGTVYTNATTTSGSQLIKFVDTIAPVITDVPFFNDITITNAGHECDVDLTIPAIIVNDECSSEENITVRVVGPTNTIFSNGGMMQNIPFGTHNIIYIAEDDCGNIATDTVSITVHDAVSPTVICEENISVSLTQDGTAWAFANTFDDGSHDNCGIDSMRVRRMETCGGTAFPNATEWSTATPFECCDIGGTVMVSLGVWDKSGNFNNCMVNVRVVDKVQPTIVCPPDLTIDCTANTDDLSVFGNATINGGNCNTTNLDDAEVTRSMTSCGAGTITRTWTLGDATCSQTITLELSPTASMQIDEIPADITVNCNDLDLSIYDNGDDLIYTSIGCQSILMDYHQTPFVGETGSCRKIIRNWVLIDDCLNPNGLEDADGDGYKGPGYQKITQVVTVVDTDAPIISLNGVPVTESLVFNYNVSSNSVSSLVCELDELTLPSFDAVDICSIEGLPVRVTGTIGSHVLVDATPGTLTNVPVGTYPLTYSAVDGCRNRATVNVQIVVTNTGGPRLYCSPRAAVALIRSNIAGSSEGSIDLWASDIACNIESCNEVEELVMVFPVRKTLGTSPPDDNRTSSNITFTCENIGPNKVEVWARDIAGNWGAPIVVEIDVQSTFCPNTENTECSIGIEGGTGEFIVETDNCSQSYTVSWTGPSNGSEEITGNINTIAVQSPGSYTVRLTNNVGEVVLETTVDVTTLQLCPTVMFNADLNEDKSGIDVTMVNVLKPATIVWNIGGPNLGRHELRGENENSYTIENLIDGQYNINVTDAKGCVSNTTISVTRNQRSQAAISGIIQNETGSSVENVHVSLAGHNSTPVMTGTTGSYEFTVPMNSNYIVTPEKEMNPLNGVSTFDLVLISKHILGIQELDTPYKHIAADINKSGTITAFDMVQLRQLILNITPDFPNNDSWRFVDANYQFATNNPENESFAEIASINDLSSDMNAHFVAVKIGDVSGNAAANTLASSEARSFNGAAIFSMKDQTFERGELVEVAFNLKDMQQVLGYQFTLDIDPTFAKIVELKEGIATEANFGLMNVERGQLTSSWNQNSNTDIEGDMFTLVLKANQAGRLSELIQLNSELTAKEAYSNTGQLLDVTLDFGTTAEAFKLYQNTPNPFKDVTTISFDLPAATTVQLTIFDVSGKLMKSISGEFNKGYNEVQINKSDLAKNGIYFYSLETAGHVAKKRMILID